MQKQNYEVEILVNGHPVKEFHRDGKVYIEGKKGQEYSVRIKNNGYKKILAVPTIDGLSVINGKPASYESPGYIIRPYSSEVIKGWRKSDSEVATFYFSDPGDSYAERTDKAGNTGVIGVAVFREKEKLPEVTIIKEIHHYPVIHDAFCGCPKCWPRYRGNGVFYSSMSASVNLNVSASSDNKVFASNNSVKQDLGTGYGETKMDSVTKVEFENEKNPDAVFEIVYNTRENLEKLGIDFNDRPKYIAPRAFPGEYCEPPKR